MFCRPTGIQTCPDLTVFCEQVATREKRGEANSTHLQVGVDGHGLAVAQQHVLQVQVLVAHVVLRVRTAEERERLHKKRKNRWIYLPNFSFSRLICLACSVFVVCVCVCVCVDSCLLYVFVPGSCFCLRFLFGWLTTQSARQTATKDTNDKESKLTPFYFHVRCFFNYMRYYLAQVSRLKPSGMHLCVNRRFHHNNAHKHF